MHHVRFESFQFSFSREGTVTSDFITVGVAYNDIEDGQIQGYQYLKCTEIGFFVVYGGEGCNLKLKSSCGYHWI